MSVRVISGDCRTVLPTLASGSVQCVVTSPPYFGLRAYLALDHPDKAAEIGVEPTLAAYIATLVAVFGEVRRVLREDATCWLNIGDGYARSGGEQAGGNRALLHMEDIQRRQCVLSDGIPAKSLLLVPHRLAIALQDDGWWVRSDVIWHKPNPMPESVADRPTSAHEHVFLLTKSARYFFDAEAVKEENSPTGQPWGVKRNIDAKTDESRRDAKSLNGVGLDPGRYFGLGRNIRNVWTVATAPSPLAHFAMMPPEIAERCIKAGSRPGDTILDPFGGVGTTGLVADRLGRDAVLIELSDAHCATARARITNDCPLFGDVA